MLVVLDNASAAQLRPLLPGGVGTAVVITSRASLGGLDGASHVHLGPLAPAEAVRMLEALLGPARPTGEPEATAALAELCDRLTPQHVPAADSDRARPTG